MAPHAHFNLLRACLPVCTVADPTRLLTMLWLRGNERPSVTWHGLTLLLRTTPPPTPPPPVICPAGAAIAPAATRFIFPHPTTVTQHITDDPARRLSAGVWFKWSSGKKTTIIQPAVDTSDRLRRQTFFSCFRIAGKKCDWCGNDFVTNRQSRVSLDFFSPFFSAAKQWFVIIYLQDSTARTKHH